MRDELLKKYAELMKSVTPEKNRIQLRSIIKEISEIELIMTYAGRNFVDSDKFAEEYL